MPISNRASKTHGPRVWIASPPRFVFLRSSLTFRRPTWSPSLEFEQRGLLSVADDDAAPGVRLQRDRARLEARSDEGRFDRGEAALDRSSRNEVEDGEFEWRADRGGLDVSIGCRRSRRPFVVARQDVNRDQTERRRNVAISAGSDIKNPDFIACDVW